MNIDGQRREGGMFTCYFLLIIISWLKLGKDLQRSNLEIRQTRNIETGRRRSDGRWNDLKLDEGEDS